MKDECQDRCDIEVKEADCYDIAWREWFESGHEYGIRDKEFLRELLEAMYDELPVPKKKK